MGGKTSGKINAGVSFQKVDRPTRSVIRNIALLEDNELATVTDVTHDRQQLLSQKQLTLVCVVDFHCSIGKVRSIPDQLLQLGHTDNSLIAKADLCVRPSACHIPVFCPDD